MPGVGSGPWAGRCWGWAAAGRSGGGRSGNREPSLPRLSDPPRRPATRSAAPLPRALSVPSLLPGRVGKGARLISKTARAGGSRARRCCCAAGTCRTEAPRAVQVWEHTVRPRASAAPGELTRLHPSATTQVTAPAARGGGGGGGQGAVSMRAGQPYLGLRCTHGYIPMYCDKC